jgi:hypothetical protein
LVSGAGAEYRNTILDDSPLAYYRFEELFGATQARDSSGSGFHSLQVNSARFGQPGICGGTAVEFSGDGNIELSLKMNPTNARPNGNGDYSIETWVKTTSAGTGQVFISQKDSGSANLGRSNMWITFERELGSFLGGGTTTSGIQPDLNRWYHLVMTVDGAEDKVRFFVDGVPSGVAQFAGVNGVESSIGNWILGSQKTQALQFFSGLLDETAFYDYRLDDPNGDNVATDSRIAAHYTACFTSPTIPGDFNGDSQLTVTDIDMLTFAVRADDQSDSRMNLNLDGRIDLQDRRVWINDLKRTTWGDADLNGIFDSTDLVQVLQSGHFEDSIVGNSTWATGDWNGDGDFTTSDLLEAFQVGFGVGPQPSSSVPEPSSLALAAGGIAWLSLYRRSKRK